MEIEPHGVLPISVEQAATTEYEFIEPNESTGRALATIYINDPDSFFAIVQAIGESAATRLSAMSRNYPPERKARLRAFSRLPTMVTAAYNLAREMEATSGHRRLDELLIDAVAGLAEFSQGLDKLRSRPSTDTKLEMATKQLALRSKERDARRAEHSKRQAALLKNTVTLEEDEAEKPAEEPDEKQPRRKPSANLPRGSQKITLETLYTGSFNIRSTIPPEIGDKIDRRTLGDIADRVRNRRSGLPQLLQTLTPEEKKRLSATLLAPFVQLNREEIGVVFGQAGVEALTLFHNYLAGEEDITAGTDLPESFNNPMIGAVVAERIWQSIPLIAVRLGV